MSVETSCYDIVGMPHRVEEEPKQGGPDQQHEQGELDELLEFIKEQCEIPGLAAYSEWKLSKAGLLSGLEEAGVLPALENRNPFGGAVK